MYHMSRTTSTGTPTATTSTTCSTRTSSNLAQRSSPSPKPPRAKTHGEWSPLLFVDCYDAPSIADSPTITFCSVHTTRMPRNVTHQPLSCNVFMPMVQHGVDLIGGDFNMSAFSTVGDVFSDPEFSAPGNALLWGAGGLDETCKVCTGFLIIPDRPYKWRVDAHGRCKFDNAELGLALRDQTAHFSCLPSPPRHQPPGPRQHYAQSTSSATTRAKTTACVDASDLHSKPTRTLWPRSPSPVPHRATHQHFGQYRPNGKTQCSGSLAASRRLCASAPSVNDTQVLSR